MRRPSWSRHLKFLTSDSQEGLGVIRGRAFVKYGATPNAVIKPKFKGILCLDTANNDLYISTDTTNAWTKIAS